MRTVHPEQAEAVASTLRELIDGWLTVLQRIIDAHYADYDRYNGKACK